MKIEEGLELIKRYVIIDDCTTRRASIYDKTFLTEQEAIQEADAEWKALSDHDKADRDAYYVATCQIDEDGLIDWDSVETIKEYK